MIPIRDNVPPRRTPWVLWVFVAANAFVFYIQLTTPAEQLEQMLRMWGIVPVEFTDPGLRRQAWPTQLMTPLTSMFLHGGWLHLLMNMWFLWIFGANVEDRMGPGRFLVFYMACGLAAGGVHIVMHPESTVPTVGASGAISGLMGGYVLLFPMARLLVVIPIIIYPLFVLLPAFVFVGIWFVIQFLGGTAALEQDASAGGVAFWAHIGGFVAGLVLTPVFARRRPPRQRSRSPREQTADDKLPR